MVEISVLTESDDPTNHAGLEKLSRLLFAPLSKADIRFSFTLVQCAEHNAVGFRVEDTTLSRLQMLIRRLAEADPGMVACDECWKRNAALGQPEARTLPHPVPAAVPSDSLVARSKLLQELGTLDPESSHRWDLLQNSLLPPITVDPGPLTATVDRQ